MSLWFVVVSQRLKPVAGPWSSWWCSAAWPWVCVLIGASTPRWRRAGSSPVNRGDEGSGLRRRRRGGLAGGLLRGEPGVELGLRLHLDHHRHEAVVAAAQLGALAAVDAGLVGVDHISLM